MGVLKNDVGRPSNKTIMIRRILKIAGIILLVGVAFGFGYWTNKYLVGKNIVAEEIKSKELDKESEDMEEEETEAAAEKSPEIKEAEMIISEIFENFPAFDEYGFPTTDSERTNLAVLNTKEAPLTTLDYAALTDLFESDLSNMEYIKSQVVCPSNITDFQCKKKYVEHEIKNNTFQDKIYKYDDVVKTFKNMFASGNIDKNLTPVKNEADPIYTGYSKKYNVFYNLGFRAGDIGRWVYGVIDVSKEGNKIYMTTARYYAGPEDASDNINDYLNNKKIEKTKILIIEENGTYKFDKVIK